MSKIFEHKLLVEFCDVDLGGGLYHPNYYKYLDSARVSALREIGMPFSSFFRSGTALVVVGIESKFMLPAMFEDSLTITTKVSSIGRTSIVLNQLILRPNPSSTGDSQTLHKSTITLAHVSLKEKKATPLPKELVEKLS